MPSPIDLKAAGIRFGPKMTSRISKTMATSRGPTFGKKATGEVTMDLVYGSRRRTFALAMPEAKLGG